MKIGFFSDTHFGFGEKTERFQETFRQAGNALRILAEQGVDLIVVPGDIFDSELPSPETIFGAMKVFSLAKEFPSTGVSLSIEKNGGSRTIHSQGIPVIAIFGNHEFRGKDRKSALELLEAAGLLSVSHASKILASKGGEETVLHCIGSVPDRKARDVFALWNPQPENGKTNILVMHQSVAELLPFESDDIATLSFADLKKGFDLVVNGHIHWNHWHEEQGFRFLIPGSIIITQMKKLESEKPKQVFVFDTKTKAISSVPLPDQRKFFYEKISFENARPEQVVSAVRAGLEKIFSQDFADKPLVRIKLAGTLAKGISVSDVAVENALKGFEAKAIFSVDRDFALASFRSRIEELRKNQLEKKSVSALGLDLLEKNLEEAGFDKGIDVRQLFRLLEENDIDGAISFVQRAYEKKLA
ncbi:MAG: DNA repair exonuclease [Candidatus Diapherotrites archaeon]|nr:DNA repair exonuclease [Candidatus Diapherotrites archaeon]